MNLNLIIPKPPSLNPLIMNHSNCSTPYISAPSSPQHPLNLFYSAPPSPTRSPFQEPHSPSAVIPFNWEFKPGVPKSSSNYEDDDDDNDDFEFEFSGQLDMMVRPSLSSADELFDGGKIRPLKPPPVMISTVDSPKSPKSPISKFRDALSPKQRKKNFEQDPFEAAIQNTMKIETQNRGRSKNLNNVRAYNRKGISRSLSPLRVSEFALQQSDQNQENGGYNGSSKWGSRKWRIRDFLLFRSASEGRATDKAKDVLSNKKYFWTKKVEEEDERGSFRSNEGSISRRRGQVSAHERHYMKNRAVSEEQKKKTSLPYKPGLLACLGFNPALHDITKGFGSFAHS